MYYPLEQLVAALILWSVFLFQFVYGLLFHRERLLGVWRVWVIFFLGCVTFTFWGDYVDMALERQFGGLPIGVYIKLYALIYAAHLDVYILAKVDPRALELPLIRWIAPVVLGLATLLLLVAAIEQWTLSAYGRLAVIAIRDTLLAQYIVRVFLPILWRMRQEDSNRVMRFRHTASVAFCASYLPVAAGNVIVFALASIQSPLAARAQALFHPLIYICVFCFICMYLPRKLLEIAERIPQIMVAYRLRQLARQLAAETGQYLPGQLSWFTLLQQQDLIDAQLYEHVVYIMDYSPQLAPDNPLARRIQALQGENLEYDQLARELAKL
jgi:hypothetical protein